MPSMLDTTIAARTKIVEVQSRHNRCMARTTLLRTDHDSAQHNGERARRKQYNIELQLKIALGCAPGGHEAPLTIALALRHPRNHLTTKPLYSAM
mmetsp:Transcript_73325/g.203430  ORF Transcript_73325/g.203430 Transcript_73325/m.203430 type:complete len:95 (+) Transcript_73325:660-944(+)